MIQKIRTSKVSKVVACYLAMMMIIEITQPLYLYALTEGPSQPEFNSFTPIGTSDMVDLTSGDFNYNIPIMDVGGYPINLAYNSGVTMDQEASWVGLGWNLNVGQINRNVRGLPDDFKGDVVKTQNNLKTNITVGVNPYFNFQLIGAADSPALSFGSGVDVQYNNYTGMSAVPSFGPSFKFSDYVSVGMQLSSSADDGATIIPSVTLSTKSFEIGECRDYTASLSPSVTYNSRRGLESFNLRSSMDYLNGYTAHSTTNITNGSGSVNFLNNTFTPTKRLAFKNNNIRFSFSAGPDVWGLHGELSIAGYASVQSLASKEQLQMAYGYENTEYGDDAALLDFNREKEQSTVSKNTLVLPVTNYTYDMYTIQGQGTGGSFRPTRSQIGNVYDGRVVDQSASNSAGLEIEGGMGAHKGLNFRTSNTTSYTGNWNTVVTPFLKEKTSGNQRDYEKVYFKSLGETRADQEYTDLLQTLGGSYPITLKIDGNKNVTNSYRRKELVGNQSLLTAGTSFSSQIKRTNREKRNQVIQKVTKAEAIRYGLSPFINYNTDYSYTTQGNMVIHIPTAPSYHTAGYIVTDENGSRSIYGETVYNKEKNEVTFNVGNVASRISNSNGLVHYNTPMDNSINNFQGRDNYFNSVTTPGYAHTYLLTSVLSSDYQDLTANGPSDDDLGSYTKFLYKKMADYKWRVPFGRSKINSNIVNGNIASYNEGLKTDNLDQKGSYLYGIKENKYLQRIETKTHVAFIDLDSREDGYGVNGAGGGMVTSTASRMYRIKSIRLYSKPEAIKANLMDENPDNDLLIAPIKTAHFEYDYSLCPNVDNNSGIPDSDTGVNLNANKGKLTLKKVYFTYRQSNMGKFTPYVFNYDNLNPDYNAKAYDIWGNYKPYQANSWDIASPLTTPQEFPYVEQTNRPQQDSYATAWSLSSIKLPSGGKIQIGYESDDYKYVQDKRAMQMFKVDGVTSNPTGYLQQQGTNKLYDNGVGEARYVVIKLPEAIQGTPNEIIKRYTDGLKGQSIYFNFLLNMTPSSYDYVTGYFVMDIDAVVIGTTTKYLCIPMKQIDINGKLGTSGNSNPITVAGCFFGRQNLNAQINDLEDPGSQSALDINVISIGKSIWDSLDFMSELFTGANGRLKEKKGCAKTFMPNKSWIRLMEPTGTKIGGGCRVKNVVLKDQWDKMLDIAPTSPDIARYAKQYGQEYSYKLEDGESSSGVATYEPNICKENPLITPFYNSPEKLTAQSYQEKPFGESFFPNPTVTYSRVTVKNITASGLASKSGSVVTQHYTSRDFPTIADYTNLGESKRYESNENQAIQNTLKGMLGLKINVTNDLRMSQGFVIETNDMNGKIKKQEVFNNSNELISSVKYNYNTETDNPNALSNVLPTIDEKGAISNKDIGTQFDVVNDLRESYSNTNSYGLAVNIDMIPLGLVALIIGWAKPERSEHKQILRTAVTTKVIHRSGILKEKIVYDLGSTVSTKNTAWDAKTGQVILTETINEFNDNYYSFNFPAYWAYQSMGMASDNIDITGTLVPITGAGTGFFMISGSAGTPISKYLKIGDEIMIAQRENKLWVTGYNAAGTGVSLIGATGEKVTSLIAGTANTRYNANFRVIRSGYRNMQKASMSSITLMKNPIANGAGNSINESFLKRTSGIPFDPKIINASAIEYDDFWRSQCENNLPNPNQTTINEYLYNIRGNWRAIRSYAFLTGRVTTNSNSRKSGFFSKFNPFYTFNTSTSSWGRDLTNWTYASEVTKYSPYGVELENKDALGRYSSAQYGYKYKLPTAVASNSTYAEMGFDGFEDYDPINLPGTPPLRTHFGFNEVINNEEVSITDETSHTGKKSIKINGYQSVVMSRKVISCVPKQ